MRVLVLNSGSSSLKARFLDADATGPVGNPHFDVLFERIGEDAGGPGDHAAAVSQLLRRLGVTVLPLSTAGERVSGAAPRTSRTR